MFITSLTWALDSTVTEEEKGVMIRICGVKSLGRFDSVSKLDHANTVMLYLKSGDSNLRIDLKADGSIVLKLLVTAPTLQN